MPSQSASRRARNERLAAMQKQQKSAERRRKFTWWGAGLVVVVILVALITVSVVNKNASKNKATGPIPVLDINSTATKLNTGQPLQTGPAPWSLPTDATPYVSAAGLQFLSAEQLAVHYHAHIDIIVNGKAVAVPALIGITAQIGSPAYSFLHTHTNDGVLHIESPQNTKFTLGQAMVEWGVRLTSTCLGGYCSDSTHDFKVFVNGQQQSGNPQNIVLKAHQEIALWYGAKSATPNVPSSFKFPAGE
jgi:hypothetical protein